MLKICENMNIISIVEFVEIQGKNTSFLKTS